MLSVHFTLYFKSIMHFLLWNLSIYTSGWWTTNMSNPEWTCDHCLCVWPIRQSECWKYPSCGTPYSETWCTAAVTWANRYFLNMQKPFKVKKGSPKISDVMREFPSTQTWTDYHVYWNDLQIVFVFLYLQVQIFQATHIWKSAKMSMKEILKFFLAQLIAMGLMSGRHQYNHIGIIMKLLQHHILAPTCLEIIFKIFCQIFML